jgi:hypothetical protein
MWRLCKWSFDLRSLSYLIYKVLSFDFVPCYLGKGKKWADVEYNIDYMKVFEWSRGFITLDELEKMFHMFSNSIDC